MSGIQVSYGQVANPAAYGDFFVLRASHFTQRFIFFWMFKVYETL